LGKNLKPMRKLTLFIILLGLSSVLYAQKVMTPEQLITLNRVSAVGLTNDMQNVIYNVSKVDIKENNRSKKTFILPLSGGKSKLIKDYKN